MAGRSSCVLALFCSSRFTSSCIGVISVLYFVLSYSGKQFATQVQARVSNFDLFTIITKLNKIPSLLQ